MGHVPPRYYVCADAVTVSWSPSKGLCVLLVRRANPPYQDCWALPGGFVEENEDLPDACLRELKEETGVSPLAIVQIGAWGAPGRDPRGRNISIAYLALTHWRPDQARAASDARQAGWHPMDRLPRLAFDHDQMIADGREKLRTLVAGTHAAFALLPAEFTVGELRQVLSAVTSKPVTETQALALMRRGAVVELPPRPGRPGGRFRCEAGDFLEPLRDEASPS